MPAIVERIRLVAITDNLRDGISGLVARARAAERGGVTMVHVRLHGEEAHTIAEVTRALVGALAVPVIVHDRVDIALAADAAGCHLGVSAVPVTAARRIGPRGFVLGASVGAAADLLRVEGADYLTIGPIVEERESPSSTKGLELIGSCATRTAAPLVAVGGLSPVNVGVVLRQEGVRGVAIMSGILGAADPESAARAFRIASGT